MKVKNKIMLLASGYSFAKKIVTDYEKGKINHSERTVEAYYKIVRTIEDATNSLSDNSRFIIENEVLNGKKNDWYVGCLSCSTYYRHSKSAYIEFLNSIEA